MLENDKAIQNIKEVLAKFQHEYIKNDSYGIDTFISEFFIDEEDTSFIGPGSSSWYFGLPQISNGINAYREDEHMYLKNIDEEFRVIPIEKRSNEDILEVQEVLKNLQEAYDKRDVKLVDL